jgi:hypothetical protein
MNIRGLALSLKNTLKMSGSPVPPVPLSFIDALYVSKVECPLYDHFVNPPQIWFSSGESRVWYSMGGATKATPVAIYSTTAFRVVLAAVSLGPIQALTAPLTLVGKAGEWTVFNSQKKKTITDLVKDLVVNQPTINGTAKPLPWGLSSDVTWTLSGNDPKQPTYTCETETEVYVFPPSLPNYVVRGGLPVRLLSLNALWPEWMRSAATDWVTFIVNAIFNDPRLEYETWSGSSKYTSGIITGLASDLANDRGLELWLDLWLTDMLGLNGVKTQMNCYDLACLVQVLVSLGTDAVTGKVRAKFMRPYGYIKDTKLIGRIDPRKDPTGKPVNPQNLCNNPFYGNNGYAKDMLVDKNNNIRSAFGNHLFVTIERAGETYVLDACCGPQTGTIKLQNYPAEAIDTRSDNRGRPGTLLDIIDGVGVNHLIVSRALGRVNPPPSSALLIDQVTQLDPTGTWNAPFFASPAQNYSISATWTLIPTGYPGKTINIDVFRYEDAYIPRRVTTVQDAYAMRVATIRDQWVVETSNEGKSDGVTGSIRIFCNPSVGYLAVVRSTELKTADTATLKAQLKILLDTSMIPTGQTWIQNINTDKSLPIKVNQSFIITITVS